VLKKAEYKNRNCVNDPDAPTLEVIYVIVKEKCYFSGVNSKSLTVACAESIIEAIARKEELPAENFRYLDLQTHLCGHPYIHLGEHQLRELNVERLLNGQLNIAGWGVADEACPPHILELFKELIGTEAPGELGRMYREGFFKRGYSQEVDQALFDVEESLRIKDFDKEVFREKWQNLLAAIADHPNVNVMNFGGLLMGMKNPEVADEALLLDQIVLQINPSCWDVWTSLGFKYEERGNLIEAKAAYLKAAEICLALGREKNLPPTNVVWADLSGCLRYAAKVESDMGENSQALAHALQACRLLRGWGHRYALDQAFHLVGEIAEKLGLKSLAEESHAKAKNYTKESEELTASIGR
jgi:tetratricopeptide (TPR) repeat protein